MALSTQTKQTIIDLLKEKIPQLKAIYIFGSYANETHTSTSDIDIAYFCDTPLTTIQVWEISTFLASQLMIDVDLINLKETNTIFRFQIISQGERIYGDGYEIESFETLAYSFYLRFQEERKPILDAIYRDKSVLKGSNNV
jgi:predicted nucleotidyltransferase